MESTRSSPKHEQDQKATQATANTAMLKEFVRSRCCLSACNCKSRDHSASEFELRISVVSVSHMIFVCQKSKHRVLEFELELSRVPDWNIRGTLLRKNSRKL